jgi:hypothetical protein
MCNPVNKNRGNIDYLINIVKKREKNFQREGYKETKRKGRRDTEREIESDFEERHITWI